MKKGRKAALWLGALLLIALAAAVAAAGRIDVEPSRDLTCLKLIFATEPVALSI
jgi:hypothetical protein